VADANDDDGPRERIAADPADRPHLRSENDAFARNAMLALAAVAALGALVWYVIGMRDERVPAAPVPAETAVKPGAQPAGAPAIQHPLPSASHADSLPKLDVSDAMLRQDLVGLIGREAFDALVYPSALVRRIVATVDNLPRRAAPRRMMPINPVPGPFRVSGQGENSEIAPENSARYAPYVRALESVDAATLVAAYVRAYPLFQQAYRELGYPDGYFNDRLVAALDDLLAAPEIGAPVKLVRPKVFYEFADPALETASAGQKIMIRMGADNARRVKAKLREIRQALAAAGASR
jgi:hypothetical protein